MVGFHLSLVMSREIKIKAEPTPRFATESEIKAVDDMKALEFAFSDHLDVDRYNEHVNYLLVDERFLSRKALISGLPTFKQIVPGNILLF